jgi:hypothetical protein
MKQNKLKKKQKSVGLDKHIELIFNSNFESAGKVQCQICFAFFK